MTAQKYLLEHGIRPTIQRLAVMNYIMSHQTHPTVNEIYTDLLPSIPTLSKTTVHNTARLFAQQKMVLQVDIDERNARFDGTLDTHAHFMCTSCGHIIDIPLPDMQNLIPQTLDVDIDEAHVNLKGICKSCNLSKKYDS